MTVIGLTGKTGSGKSSVCAELKKTNIVYIIDTDVLARKIVEKDMPALNELCGFFGGDILNGDGTLNRKALAKKAFSSEESTEKLNSITHPYITKEVGKEIEFAKENGYEFCVIDAAALLESDCKSFCDVIAVVAADEQTRLERILERDSLDNDSALQRIRAQKNDEYYFKNADIIIMNEGGGSVSESARKLLDFAKGKI
ncbi:MAG: dephospho-CoA kinase [Clostridia bacterium]|nr:dephospho-CoA kinase [Clostridia bacterium]